MIGERTDGVNSPVRIFVYGTLKCGEPSYHLCARHVVDACPAIALGQLYALPMGYPAMVPGEQPVQGFMLSLKTVEILALLDEYEQHDPDAFGYYAPGQPLAQHQYHRRQVKVYSPEGVPIGTAWAYLMSSIQVHNLGGVLIPDGQWSLEKQRSAFNGLHPE